MCIVCRQHSTGAGAGGVRHRSQQRNERRRLCTRIRRCHGRADDGLPVSISFIRARRLTLLGCALDAVVRGPTHAAGSRCMSVTVLPVTASTQMKVFGIYFYLKI